RRLIPRFFMNGTTASPGQYSGVRLFTILGNLRQDLTAMIKSELALLKNELSASISTMGKDGLLVVIGGFIAYTGAIFALFGIAAIIAFALHEAGLSILLASSIAFF